MTDSKENKDGSFVFMCGKCFQVYPLVQEIGSHNCVISKDNGTQILETSENYITAEVIKLEPPYSGEDNGTALIVNDKGKLEYETIDGIDEITRELDMRNITDDTEYEIIEDEGVKRKRKVGNNDYIMNKLVRDPYFKLDHNSYTFKDTLGDWDERSTKLLIILVGKYPKVHFLLQFYFERRLTHWESIHSCMINAGYNFTVLQLRMRWREVFAKYRWTLNHNDLNEEKKSFEYMKEMNDLFGVWPAEATETLINLVEYNYKDNPSAKHKRLGYLGWERVATLMAREGFKYSVLQVEARWRMLVTTFKSMVDHNIMPTVEPIVAAFQDRLSLLVNYEPRRRKDYERFKGKKVKLEKFPENGMKHLIHSYKQNINKFMDNSIKNSEVWDEIRKSLESIGFSYSVTKIKEIFFATLKLFERILQHNSIPGAIKREGPHFKELSEILNIYGFWPHVKRKRKTTFEKHHRKCAQRLRDSMQTWTTDESRALLKLYPDILESLMGQTASTQQNDLWVQVAQAFQALGFSKRDTPEIATHIGLLRQGYNQGNNFPFQEEMQRVIKVEEALCYSPDVSKFTGDVEILYWSHDAIYLMLNLYFKIQPLLPYSSLSKEVYARIAKEMAHFKYKYTCDEVKEEFRNLLFQFTMRRYKPEKASVENWAKNKGILLYKEEMKQVMLLREKLSVGFTNGIKPIPDDVLEVIFRVAREKCEELFSTDLTWDEQKERMKLVIFIIRRQIKKIVKRKPPVARKICVQLLSSLFNITETTEMVSDDLAGLYCALENYDYEKILTEIMKETHNGSFKLPRRVLDMEKQTDVFCSWEEVPDALEPALEPLCVLNVSEVKQENTADLKNADPLSLPASGCLFRKRNMNSLSSIEAFDAEESELSLGYSSGLFFNEDEEPLFREGLSSGYCESRPSGIEVGEWNDDLVSREGGKSFNKLVLINKCLGTKTTVVPQQEGSHVTRIHIDDLEVKEEPLSPAPVDRYGSSPGGLMQFYDEGRVCPPLNECTPGMSGSGAEFDVVYSLNEGELESVDAEGEEEASREGTPSLGDGTGPSLLSMLDRQIETTRNDETSFKVLKKHQTERKEFLNDLLIQINEMVDQ